MGVRYGVCGAPGVHYCAVTLSRRVYAFARSGFWNGKAAMRAKLSDIGAGKRREGVWPSVASVLAARANAGQLSLWIRALPAPASDYQRVVATEVARLFGALRKVRPGR